MNQSTQTMTRRQFMVVAGCGCAGLVIAGTGCARVGPVTAAAAAACPYSYRYDPYPGPVSYTHLDVYKRQQSSWAR